jgi:hypothetical protein
MITMGKAEMDITGLLRGTSVILSVGRGADISKQLCSWDQVECMTAGLYFSWGLSP